jgi:hypothetical protein
MLAARHHHQLAVARVLQHLYVSRPRSRSHLQHGLIQVRKLQVEERQVVRLERRVLLHERRLALGQLLVCQLRVGG